MNRAKLFALPLLLSPLLIGCNSSKKSYIGIISAMDNEIDLLLEEAKIDRKDEIGGTTYHIGTLHNKNVIIAKSGIGKVYASCATTVLLDRYNISNVIFTGIAGGVKEETEVLDEVIATRLVEHDYGSINNDGFVWTGGDPGKLEPAEGDYYYCDEGLVDLAYNASVEVMGENHTYKGTIATGDQFIASSSYVELLKTKFNAYACEMEGASVAKVCDEFDTPYVVIRALSDLADGNAHESYEDFGDLAAYHSSRIVLKMIDNL